MCGNGGEGGGGGDDSGGGFFGGYSGLADMADGGGPGQSGDTFGGAFGGISNAAGATPRGSGREATGLAGIAAPAFARDDNGGLTNTAAALRGAAMGGLPGMIAGVAMNQATGGQGIMGAAKGLVGGLTKGADSSTGQTESGQSRPAGLSQRGQESMIGEGGGSIRVAPTVSTGPTASDSGATVTLPQMPDMSTAAAQGAFIPLPNPNYDPTNPMSQQFMSNPTYDQLLDYRNTLMPVQGMAEGGEVGGNEKTVISDAISAVKGAMGEEDAAVVLGKFVAAYGREVLQDLVQRVQSGEYDDTVERFANGEAGAVRGPGDGSGVDDKVPATLEGEQDVLLADGEYVLRKKTADALEKKYGGGFLDKVNQAEDAAPRAMQEYMSRA